MKPLSLSPNDSTAAVKLENDPLLYAFFIVVAAVTARAYSRVIYCKHSFPKLTLRRRLSRGHKVFPSATTEILWMTVVIRGPSSVATFRATIEQSTKAHTAFSRGLVGQILVRRPPDLPDLLLRPCKVLHVCEVGSMEQAEGGVILQRDPHTISHCHHVVHLCTLVGVDLECCLRQSETQ